MKNARWIPVIAVLNLCIAAAFILGLGRWFGPGPQRVSPFFLFTMAVAALGVATAVGLWLRQDWARRWTIVLWTICMVLAVPMGMVVGFRQFGVAGAVMALTLTIGLPVLVASYLSKPEIKLALGCSAPTDSGRRTLTYMLGGFAAGLVVIVWMAMEMLKAIGRGLR